MLRLAGVEGVEGRANDVLFHPAARRTPAPPTLLYFGGDVQEYREVMCAHRDNARYVRWCLERTACHLSACFPASHVLLVKPARIERKTLSCYDNFVPSDHAGVPHFTPCHGALTHLHRLLQNVSVRLKEMPEAELLQAINYNNDTEQNGSVEHNPTSCEESTSEGGAGGAGGATHAAEYRDTECLWWVAGVCLQESRLELVGFSKGCVVLNQLVHEIHHARDQLPGLVSQISSLYWLDGGHAGGRDTWLTAPPLLETLATLEACVYVHVSPYQVRDKARPWIRREEAAFTRTLTSLGAKVRRYFHASPPPHSLLTHFSVLDNFKRVQDHNKPETYTSTDLELR